MNFLEKLELEHRETKRLLKQAKLAQSAGRDVQSTYSDLRRYMALDEAHLYPSHCEAS